MTIPSQIRYVHYYGDMLNKNLVYEERVLFLKKIIIHTIPRISGGVCGTLESSWSLRACAPAPCSALSISFAYGLAWPCGRHATAAPFFVIRNKGQKTFKSKAVTVRRLQLGAVAAMARLWA